LNASAIIARRRHNEAPRRHDIDKHDA